MNANSSSGDKGKNRAKVEDGAERSNNVVDHSESQTNQDSIASRVLASAAGLAKDVMGSSSGSLTSSLAASTSANGKTVPSSAGTGIQKGAESSHSIQKSSTAVSDSNQRQEAFRTQQEDASIMEEYTQFQQHGDPLNQEFLTAPLQKSNDWAAQFNDFQNHVKEYSQSDGLEVQLLLSDPYFNAMTDTPEPVPDLTPSDVSDLFGSIYTAEEEDAAKQLKKDLPPAPIFQPIAADNSRNLVANLEAMLEPSEYTGYDTSHAFQGPIHFHSQEQQKQWYHQWSGVLNQYTDEVWGDMLPLVREEQKHAEAIIDGKEDLGSRSVQRLNMILGHVEQYRHKTVARSNQE